MSQNLAEPLSANFTLTGSEANGNPITKSFRNVIISRDEVQNFEFDVSFARRFFLKVFILIIEFLCPIIEFQTKDLTNGDYTFHADVYDPVINNFMYDKWPLQFLSTLYHIVIQTDKEIYKAEDLIRFRMFAFDSDTRPVEVAGSPVISIIDPQNFTIREITNFTFTNGRYKNDFQLSNFVTTGIWIIKIQVEGQVNKKTFNHQDEGFDGKFCLTNGKFSRFLKNASTYRCTSCRCS